MFADDGFCEMFYFFKLRAELQQEEIHACCVKLGEALGNLFGRSHQTGAQPAI